MKINHAGKIAILLIISGCLAGFNSQAQQGMASNTDESKVPPYTLPDVLRTSRCKRVEDSKEWMQVQRPYIYHLYEENQFGRFP